MTPLVHAKLAADGAFVDATRGIDLAYVSSVLNAMASCVPTGVTFLLCSLIATPANRVAAERDRIHQLRRKKLVGIYEKHNPDKLKDVDALLKAYAGRESALFEKLEKKYYAAEVAFSKAPTSTGSAGAVQRVGDLTSQLSKIDGRANDDDY